MNEKSHVGMESRECILCDEVYDTGTLFLDRRLKDSLERHNVVGPGICNKCKELHTGRPLSEYDHVALVEIDPDKSSIAGPKVKSTDTVHLTGVVCFLAKHKAKEIFDEDITEYDFSFVDAEIVAMLDRMAQGVTVQ